jgi:hypothetical protein
MRPRVSAVLGVSLAAVLATGATALVLASRSGGSDGQDYRARAAALPTDGPFKYRVEYLGIKCGEMTLESRLDSHLGRPAYHIVMTARNAKFFNAIYRVDARLESWVDAESLTTVAYLSDSTERGTRKIVRYEVDPDRGSISITENGEVSEVSFDGEAGLDPMAFIFRSRLLAGDEGSAFPLTLMTDDGGIETTTFVGPKRRFHTFDGRRELLKLQPQPVDEEMFARKGVFVVWIEPGGDRTLYRLDFKLSFGRLVAKLVGDADGPVDRRDPRTVLPLDERD